MRHESVDSARKAAIEVLRHNSHGPYGGLPRTAGWGYPEPYTRDWLIAALGIFASGDEELIQVVRRVLEVLAGNQSPHGHISSLVHDPDDRGASDTTPLFLFAAGLYRKLTGEEDFLAEAVQKALNWMDFQSPDDTTMVAQLPTSDWRDEQWVLGYGLFVNAVVYSYLRLFRETPKAGRHRRSMSQLTITEEARHRHVHEGLVVRHKPYFALWSYKIHSSERFDLLGNSWAVLSGIGAPSRSEALISWVEHECESLRERGLLACDLPPNFFPYIQPQDPDWMPRYAIYNKPGEYHNGGIWPFVCGFYVAAVVAAGKQRLAEQKLEALTRLVKPSHRKPVAFGFNEWFRAQDGTPQGEDWQTWSAAMYLYAAEAVQQGATPFFDKLRVS